MKKNIVEKMLFSFHLKPLIGENTFWNGNDDNIWVYLRESKELINPNNSFYDSLLATIIQLPESELCCISTSFNASIIMNLMFSGFYIMSQRLYISSDEFLAVIRNDNNKYFVNKILMRAFMDKKYPILFFENMHIKKSAKRMLYKYDLKINYEQMEIINQCCIKHGNDGWLYKPLRECFKRICLINNEYIKLLTFGVYRDNILKAGEFGFLIGRMYFSYSGFYYESGAGTIQMIKTFEYLKQHDCACANLFGYDNGVYKYKYDLGAKDIDRNDYIKLFKELRGKRD